jgi:hypothetical protein
MFARAWQATDGDGRSNMPSYWFQPIDLYCERTDPGFWSEPLNALSNASFILAAGVAFLLWRRAGGRDVAGLWLIAAVAIVGTGSFLFHTFATRWSMLADVIPIAVFVYSYVVFALRRYLGLGWPAVLAATGAFALLDFNFARLWTALFGDVTLNGSIRYLPAAMALIIVGALCAIGGDRTERSRIATRALFGAMAVFGVSLTFRSIDQEVCGSIPTGTHVLWHLLNGLVLFILIAAAIRVGPWERRDGDLRAAESRSR